MNESITELKRLHLLSKPELKKALINIENIIRNDDGEAALFSIQHLSDAIKSHDHVEDILFAEIESQKEEIEKQTKTNEGLKSFGQAWHDTAIQYVNQIESLKAITELAVKGLEEIKATLDMDRSTMQKFSIWDLAKKTLEQLRKVSP